MWRESLSGLANENQEGKQEEGDEEKETKKKKNNNNNILTGDICVKIKILGALYALSIVAVAYNFAFSEHKTQESGYHDYYSGSIEQAVQDP